MPRRPNLMTPQDIDDAAVIARRQVRLGLAQPEDFQAATNRLFELARQIWVKDDTPDFLVSLTLTARLRHAEAKGRNWAAAVQKLAGPRIDAMWLAHHAARRLAELKASEPLDMRDPLPFQLRETDPRYARFRLAVMIEDEGRPPRRASKAEAA